MATPWIGRLTGRPLAETGFVTRRPGRGAWATLLAKTQSRQGSQDLRGESDRGRIGLRGQSLRSACGDKREQNAYETSGTLRLLDGCPRRDRARGTGDGDGEYGER